jgi:CO/xanthine dehydrogenase FAD-binding subunit
LEGLPGCIEESTVIVEYHRPQSLDQVLQLLGRAEPHTLPMGGGTTLNRPSAKSFAVVDLQGLPLNTVSQRGSSLDIGATVTLQSLIHFSKQSDVPFFPALRRALEQEVNYNLRHVSTLAGRLVAAGGRSTLVTALLALDAHATLLPGDENVAVGDLLLARSEKLPGRLITHLSLPLKARLAFEYVARTPADWPLVCAAAARWPSGRTRLALGGFGGAPILALDGPEPGGVEAAARDAFSAAGDEWASAEYRQDTAATLARRCLAALE